MNSINENIKEELSGKRVLITGGLGMLGSTVASHLVEIGADVTLLDACIKPFGSNNFNISEIKDRVKVVISDIRDKEAVHDVVVDKDIIFNFAAQVSHNDSLKDPFLDADINYLGHLNILEAVKNCNPNAVILFSGSRLQFGEIEKNPVVENHPLKPLTPYALNKTAAENLYLYYNRVYGIPAVVFRIANPYGPRSQIRHSKYCMVNWFIRQAMENKAIQIFGNGNQIRDYIYIDDLCNAFLIASVTDKAWGEVFNIGSGMGIKFGSMAEKVIEVVGKGKIEYIPWPDNYLNVETGDYITDIGKIKEFIGWHPDTSFEDGLKLTAEFYKKYWDHYC